MDVNYINPFFESTRDILETTSSIRNIPQKPYVKKGNVAAGEVSCVIALTGDFKGTIAVSFTTPCILNIVSKMFGEEMTEINDDIKDAVGEIGNMISGQVTTKLNALEKNLKAGLSDVHMGEGHTIEHLPDTPVISMPHKTEKGEYTIEVCLEDK
ncbi:MAG: chemotaxis protein CheX [Desulfobacterales bacterium]|nr:chemotaxis protein CheX [Desulfobacterales bacterium]